MRAASASQMQSLLQAGTEAGSGVVGFGDRIAVDRKQRRTGRTAIQRSNARLRMYCGRWAGSLRELTSDDSFRKVNDVLEAHNAS